MRGASLVLIARGAWGVNVVLRHMRRCHFHKLMNIFLPHSRNNPVKIGKKIYAVNRFIVTHPYTPTFRLGVLRAFHCNPPLHAHLSFRGAPRISLYSYCLSVLIVAMDAALLHHVNN